MTSPLLPYRLSLHRYTAISLVCPVPSRPSCPIPDLICQRRDANTDLPLESLGQRLVSTRPSRDPHAPNSSPVANSLSPRTRRLQRRRRRNAPWRWLKCLHTFFACACYSRGRRKRSWLVRQTDRQTKHKITLLDMGASLPRLLTLYMQLKDIRGARENPTTRTANLGRTFAKVGRASTAPPPPHHVKPSYYTASTIIRNKRRPKNQPSQDKK